MLADYLYWSPRLGYIARVYYFLSLTLSVCLSQTNFKLILLFCFWMESSHFLPPVLHVALYKTFLDFWFRPPNAQNLRPKIWTKSPISRLVWQIDRRYLGLLGGFRRWPIQWNHAKCCGPTFVAMATKFGLGAEILTPTGLYYCGLVQDTKQGTKHSSTKIERNVLFKFLCHVCTTAHRPIMTNWWILGVWDYKITAIWMLIPEILANERHLSRLFSNSTVTQ